MMVVHRNLPSRLPDDIYLHLQVELSKNIFDHWFDSVRTGLNVEEGDLLMWVDRCKESK